MRVRAPLGSVAALVAGVLGCRTPTQITVEVRTDVPCGSAPLETSITVGLLGATLEEKPPVTVTSRCVDQRIGALVVVPSGDKDSEIALRIVSAVGKPTRDCVAGKLDGCIVARRALRFVPHESLDLPIVMRKSCANVPCDSLDKTCVDGRCVSATISDPGACHGEGCNELTLLPSGDAGVPDATTDGGGVAIEFAKQLGQRVVDLQADVAVDKDGNVFVATSFTGATDVAGARTSKGGHDALLAKISRAGIVQWVKQLGDVDDDYGLAVATDPSGSVLLAGSTDGDIDLGGGLIKNPGFSGVFLARYDSAGKFLGGKRFHGGSVGAPVGLAIDASGNVFLAGNTGVGVDFGGGFLGATSNDVFLARFSADLSLLGNKMYGGSKDDFMYGFAGTRDGGVVLAGVTNGSIDFGDGPRTTAGGYDAYVARIDSAFVAKWSRVYGDPGGQGAHSVAVDDTDRAIVTGFFEGTVDFGDGPRTGASLFVLGLDKAGARTLTKTYASSYATFVNGIDTNAAGDITLGGYFEGTLSFGGPTLSAPLGTDRGDMFLVQLDASGGHVRSRSFGDTGAWQQLIDLAIDRPTGAIAVVGGFGGTMAFPFQTLTTTTYEGFVARLFP